MDETTRPKHNLIGLDYRAEAQRMSPPPVPIIDGHSHINGARASRVYADVRKAFGVTHTFTQTQLRQAEAVRDVLGDTVSFVAVPNYMSENPSYAHTKGYIDDITTWHRDFGARMLKFWCGPRGREFARDWGDDPKLFTLGHPWRRKQMDHAASLGYMFMAHLADPDTWFEGKYTDTELFGTKAEQYDDIEELADEYDIPWLIAHMGGWPEDLDFLTGFLDRHPNVIIDTSATKWMVRELSKHPTEEFAAFLERFRGRVIFGSDIVTDDAHVTDDEGWRGIGLASSSEEEAWDLYASRYWALRTLFEGTYEGPSPIADPDLHMVDPEHHEENDSPTLKGHNLGRQTLQDLYRDAVENTILKWYDDHA